MRPLLLSLAAPRHPPEYIDARLNVPPGGDYRKKNAPRKNGRAAAHTSAVYWFFLIFNLQSGVCQYVKERLRHNTPESGE